MNNLMSNEKFESDFQDSFKEWVLANQEEGANFIRWFHERFQPQEENLKEVNMNDILVIVLYSFYEDFHKSIQKELPSYSPEGIHIGIIEAIKTGEFVKDVQTSFGDDKFCDEIQKIVISYAQEMMEKSNDNTTE